MWKKSSNSKTNFFDKNPILEEIFERNYGANLTTTKQGAQTHFKKKRSTIHTVTTREIVHILHTFTHLIYSFFIVTGFWPHNIMILVAMNVIKWSWKKEWEKDSKEWNSFCPAVFGIFESTKFIVFILKFHFHVEKKIRSISLTVLRQKTNIFQGKTVRLNKTILRILLRRRSERDKEIFINHVNVILRNFIK